MGAFRTPIESLGLVSASDKWVFAGLSLHLKIPFLAIVETGFDDCLVSRQFEPLLSPPPVEPDFFLSG
jgi:hypothetical protein